MLFEGQAERQQSSSTECAVFSRRMSNDLPLLVVCLFVF